MAEADTLFQIEHIHNVTWTSPGALQLSIHDTFNVRLPTTVFLSLYLCWNVNCIRTYIILFLWYIW